MRVIVTGAAGFIGGHLANRLRGDGHAAFCTDIVQKHASIDPWDIREQAPVWLRPFSDPSWDGLGPTIAVHLAAIASPNVCTQDPKLAWETNVMGTYNVLQWLRGLGVKRVVFMSSAHVYGISPKYLPTDENHPLAMLDTYTVTKILGEQFCEMFWRNHGLSYCALRLFNGYGQGQDEKYFIGAKIAQARKGELTIRGGTVTKDWVHVSDVCDAIVRALQSDFVGPINIGTGVETHLGKIVETIAFHAGHQSIRPDGDADSGPTRMCADWLRARSVLGWEPKVKFEDGLQKLVEDSIAAAL